MSEKSSHKLLLVGRGKMGEALQSGWEHSLPSLSITSVDPHSADANFKTLSDIPDGLGPFDCIVLAVKPQMMQDVLKDVLPFVQSGTLVRSIAAGKSISFYEESLGRQCSIVRVMPNTPAAIGYGMSVLYANGNVTESEKALASTLMKTVGLAEWISDEGLMDAVTAVSGSGPAYVFYLIEALAKAGEAVGLSAELSMTLARQTVAGSGALVSQNETVPAATLRQNVTSPGGTTEAALKVLMNDANGLTSLMTDAVNAARDRGRELAKQNS